jgi:hypothetical protein
MTTAYWLPYATGAGIAKLVVPESTVSVSLLFVSTRPLVVRPLIDPPTLKGWSVQLTATVLTLLVDIVPVP